MTLNGFVPTQTVNYLVLRHDDNRSEYELLDFDVSIMTPPQPKYDDLWIRDSRNVLGGCLFGELQPSLGIELGMNASKKGNVMEMPYSTLLHILDFKQAICCLKLMELKLRMLNN